MTGVTINKLVKQWDDFRAVNEVSFTAEQGTLTVLLGPSGCGKSTILRMIAGLESVDSGEVRIGEQDMTNQDPAKRGVSMVFQSYALFPHMSVAKNIGFGLAREGQPKAEIKTRVEEMLALVQLEPFANRKPHQLSGGQRQRVALARSLAKRPRLVLLDEPLAALDKKLREETQFELMNIQESIGVTFIIVTHDQEEAMTVASRIAVMQSGNVEQVSPPAELYERPCSRYVADFVGDVNIIEGKLRTVSEGVADIAWGPHDTSLKVEIRDPSLQSNAQTLWAAIRPEKVQISLDRPVGVDNAVQGAVWDIAYTGSTSTYHVRLDDGSILKSREVNQSAVADRHITWDDRVWLHWPATAGVLLER